MADRSRVISGGMLGVIGVFGFIGAITGNLAKMLAALWDPTDLTGASQDPLSSALSSSFGQAFNNAFLGLPDALNSVAQKLGLP